ncbi:hypothetical protein [Elizabethkingia sp. 2-6]|uniref:hypothetical protein n=1 Tax=Elizabethkingia sp. 2-6 TaxID=2575699 RepID=UPI0010C18268|nr:hypothetical protein [Elizabethkingia sp. 2-6]QCO45799.1 hypothetical protein FCS00_05225 [Elizabethkingia sp. 2-6]
MENNLENKSMFFAQYYGQNVKRSYLPEQTSLQVIDREVFWIGHLIINGYFRTKYEEALKNLTNFDEDYFNDENRIKLYVLLSSLQNKEIMSHLQDIYTISQQIPPSEYQVIEMINELLDQGVEF